MTAGDPVPLETRIKGALNIILDIFGIPEDIRRNKIGKVFAMDYRSIGKQVLADFKEYVKEKFQIPFVMLYQSKENCDKVYERIAVMPGSGKSDKKLVVKSGYDLFLTGDFGHHDGLDAVDMGLTVIDATHYGLEHIFIAYISDYLKQKCTGVQIVEKDSGCPMKVV